MDISAPVCASNGVELRTFSSECLVFCENWSLQTGPDDAEGWRLVAKGPCPRGLEKLLQGNGIAD